MTVDETRYGFGANWKSFVDTSLNERRIQHAVDSVRSYLGIETLAGKHFLDVGCGSGLFSLCACLLGAERVSSFDCDPESVEAATRLRERQRVPETLWGIEHGSVLDAEFMARHEPADVVYSWGVLHHTGRMWDAIDAAAAKVKPGGLFAISIYNRVDRFPDKSKMWWHVKRAYTRGPAPVRWALEACYVSHFALTRLVTLRNPFAAMLDREGAGRRGMDFMHDVRDWLGGFPYEYATSGEVFQHVHDRHPMELVRLVNWEGNACNELLFRRR